MLKKFISLLTALLLSLLMVGTVCAADETSYIRDEVSAFSSQEIEQINKEAKAIDEQYHLKVAFLATKSAGEAGIQAYAEKIYQESFGTAQGILLAVDAEKDEWTLYYAGNAEKRLGEASDDLLWEAFDSGETNYSGVRYYLNKAVTLLTQRTNKLLVDEADLLDSDQEKTLLEKLEDISQRQKCDVVLVTVNSLEGKSVQDFADDYFDFNGYGQGKDHDGVLLLLSMTERKWHISTAGYGITAFTDAGLEYLSEQFLPDLKDGDYNAAFTIYADQCDDFLTQAREGQPYDVKNLPKKPLSWYWIPGALAIGFGFAFLIVTGMKGQLKTVHQKTEATDYVKKDSLHITNADEFFLFSEVSKQAKPEPNRDDRDGSDSGGSSTHESSSGRTHGGSGGSFQNNAKQAVEAKFFDRLFILILFKTQTLLVLTCLTQGMLTLPIGL